MEQSTQLSFLNRNSRFIALGVLLLIVAAISAEYFAFNAAIESDLPEVSTINVAGQQATLSQRISKNVALLINTENPALRSGYINSLDEDVALLETAHNGLTQGDSSLNLSGDQSDEITRLFTLVDPSFTAIVNSTNCIVAVERGASAGSGCSTDIDALGRIVLANEADYAIGMNRIIFQYEAEWDDAVASVQRAETLFFGAALLAVGILFITVILPLTVTSGRIRSELNTAQTNLDATERALSVIRQQSEERARSLQAVIELTTRASTTLNLNQLLRDVTDLTRDNFGLNHAQIFLATEQQQRLNLVAGAGYIGAQLSNEGHTIDIDDRESIVAKAARSRDTIVENNIGSLSQVQSDVILDNTSSMMAIVLTGRSGLIGVLDVQSEQPGFFNNDRITVLDAVGTQVAIALNNAFLFQSLQQVTDHERALGTITRTIETASTIDEVLQTTVRELGKALRVPHTAIELQLNENNPSTNTQGTE